MKENQKTITSWAQTTFDNPPASSVAVRMMVEVSEMLCALTAARRDDARKECADIGVMILQLAELLGKDVSEVIKVAEGLGAALDDPHFSFVELLVYATTLNHHLSQLTAGVCSGDYRVDKDAIVDDVTRCVVILWDLSFGLGVPRLSDLIDAKMERNRSRTWAKLPNGVWQHSNKE